MVESKVFRGLLIGAALFGFGAPAQATEIVFNGSMTGTAVGAVAPGCAPLPRQSTLNGPGSSSLGLFGYSHQVCLAGVGPIQGNFLFDFSGGNTLYGSITGSAVANATPGLFDIALAYNILGGSGLFLDSAGSFQGIGIVDQRNLPTTRVSINFSAVPEPGTWAMMLLGFAAAGIALRRRTGRRPGLAQMSSRSTATGRWSANAT